MDEIPVTIPSSKDAQLIKAVLKKFKGVKIHNGAYTKGKKNHLPVAPSSKTEFKERIKQSEQEAKEGKYITGPQLKKEMYKWRKERGAIS